MKPTELRIGNSCLYKINGEEKGKEIIIDAQDLVAISQFFVASKISPYYAIPLTEEWLKKFGFRNGSSGMPAFWWIGVKELLSQPNTDNQIFNYWPRGDSFSIQIKYVHQLQNLYFALTGEELTLSK